MRNVCLQWCFTHSFMVFVFFFFKRKCNKQPQRKFSSLLFTFLEEIPRIGKKNNNNNSVLHHRTVPYLFYQNSCSVCYVTVPILVLVWHYCAILQYWGQCQNMVCTIQKGCCVCDILLLVLGICHIRYSIRAQYVPIGGHTSSASSGGQQLYRPCTPQTTKFLLMASTLTSACVKHTSQNDILKTARYEKALFLLFFLQMLDKLLSLFVSFLASGCTFSKITAEIKMHHKGFTTIKRITSYVLSSVKLSNQTGYFLLLIHIQGIVISHIWIYSDSVWLYAVGYV